MAEYNPDWLIGRWKISMVGARSARGGYGPTENIVWEFQHDGVFIERIPGCELYVTGYLYRHDRDMLYILRCDPDRELRPEGYRITKSEEGRMFLERMDSDSGRIYLFEAEPLTGSGD